MQKSIVYIPGDKDFSECIYFDKNETKKYKDTNFYERKGEKKWVIVFFHWNAWRACERSYIKLMLEKTWYSFIFVEYSWYSDPDNSNPNIDDILNNVEDIWKYLEDKNYENIYVMWRSIWTWPASYLSSIIEIDKLLLISPYSQLYKIWADKYPIYPIKYLFTENYNSEHYLKNYAWEILVVHWKQDIVVPYKFWKELFDWLKSYKKEFISLEKWTHHNVFDFKESVDKIEAFFD
jgi:esterase/lipase